VEAIDTVVTVGQFLQRFCDSIWSLFVL